MKRELPYKQFGPVTVEFYEKRDPKTNIAVGKPMVKTVFPAERFLIDARGEVVFGEDGHAIRIGRKA